MPLWLRGEALFMSGQYYTSLWLRVLTGEGIVVLLVNFRVPQQLKTYLSALHW